MLHTKFQASKPSGSEVEDFFYIFLCISMARNYDPWPQAILDPGTFHSNKLGRGLLGNATYQISNTWALWF